MTSTKALSDVLGLNEEDREDPPKIGCNDFQTFYRFVLPFINLPFLSYLLFLYLYIIQQQLTEEVDYHVVHDIGGLSNRSGT